MQPHGLVDGWKVALDFSADPACLHLCMGLGFTYVVDSTGQARS